MKCRDINDRGLNFQIKWTEPETLYGCECRECSQSSPLMLLQDVVNWVRRHNYERHEGQRVTRRSKFDKRVQSEDWRIARRALKKLGCNPISQVQARQLQALCQYNGCGRYSQPGNQRQLEEWIVAHQRQYHPRRFEIRVVRTGSVEEAWK